MKKQQHNNKGDYMFRLHEGQLLMKLPGQLQGSGFRLDRLKCCEVYLLDWTSQVMVDDCVDCRIFIGPCAGSVFVRDCTRCTLCVATRQLRTRDCTDLDISLYCTSQPTIETTTRCTFSPWRGAYPNASEHFAAAKLDPAHNQWDQVYDFNAREEIQGQLQHWQLQRAPRVMWIPPSIVSGHTVLSGTPENPVPGVETQGQEEVGTLPCPQFAQAPAPIAGQLPVQQTAAGSAAHTDAREVWLQQNKARLVRALEAEAAAKAQARAAAQTVLKIKQQARAAHIAARHNEVATAQAHIASAEWGTAHNAGWAGVCELLGAAQLTGHACDSRQETSDRVTSVRLPAAASSSRAWRAAPHDAPDRMVQVLLDLNAPSSQDAARADHGRQCDDVTPS